jgi:L-asparaginase / beta-aspartyl-peptidase
MQKYTIVIHGGAGTILKQDMTDDLEASYKAGLQQALDAGYAILQEGGSATEAVKTAVVVLEDNPLFNAGKGSVFTNNGGHEMDAAIMEGKTLEAGAVAGVQNIRNPIELANLVMTNSNHVFLSGAGAKAFGEKNGLALERDDYFFSQFRHDQWTAIKDTDGFQLDHQKQEVKEASRDKKFGTVGAVACDQHGNVAAATSTGGMTNKMFGRVGDSPMIGAGTYANNRTCAISCTGHGEIFIKAVTAYDISALMEYKNLSLENACKEVVLNKLVKMEGEGGVIGVDAQGNAAMVFNSEGMYRGMKSSDGTEAIAIYK